MDEALAVQQRDVTKKGVRRRRRRTAKPRERHQFSGRERMLIIDSLGRSGLTVTDFSAVCGVPRATLYAWQRRFAAEGPAGLEDKPRRSGRSRLPEETKRSILMLKELHPDWGCQRIHDVLLRSNGFTASPGAILRVLKQAGYEVQSPPAQRHRDKKRRFERARPNQLWQSDLFTWTLKSVNRRVHLVGFMDDHSRMIVSHQVAASPALPMVKEALLTGVTRFGLPDEVLTDNGPPYATWRGTSRFSRLLKARGIAHLRSRPRHPQTLGKIERFWQSLWQECLVDASLRDIDEARRLIAEYIDKYNFFRPHQGIAGLVPADRFFDSGSTVRATLEGRAKARLQRPPTEELYLTGRVGDQAISLHSEGDRLVLVDADGSRREVTLGAPVPAGGDATPATEPEVSGAGEQPEASPAEPVRPMPAVPINLPALDAVILAEDETPAVEPEVSGAGEQPEASPAEPVRPMPAVPIDLPARDAVICAEDSTPAVMPEVSGPGESALSSVLRELSDLYRQEASDDQ